MKEQLFKNNNELYFVYKMTKIDLKDRKILYQLDLNCRQSNTQIGKKVGLKRDVVAYRIKKMEDEGIIHNYWTIIDAYKLGYIVFRFYLVFQYVTQDIKNNIIDFLVKDKHTWVVASLIGRYDLTVFLWLKDINDFYRFWDNLLDKYGDFFEEKVFSIYVQGETYHSSYLLKDLVKEIDRKSYSSVGGGTTIEIDSIDFQLLNEIAENARAPLIDLAKKLNCTSQTINYRLKNLMDQKIIQGFRVSIDISKLGLKHFKVDAHLKENSKRKDLMTYTKKHPNLMFIGTSAGVSDLELEFYLEDSEQLNQIMDDTNNKFPGAIRRHEYFIASKTHKLRFMPEV